MSGNGWLRQLLVHSPIKSDKIAHGVLYFGLSGLMANFLGRWTRSKRILAPLTFALVMTYGVLDEYLQSFVPTRSADPYDLLADAVGTFIGTTVFIGLRSGKARLKNQRGPADSPVDPIE